MDNYGIHWFRRDLRVAGNPGFKKNFKAHDGRVVGMFCFDKDFLSRGDFSVNRFQFFLDSLSNLKQELQDIGSDLLFLDIGPEKAFPELLRRLQEQSRSPALVTWNRDYEPFARRRDLAIAELFKGEGVTFETFRDHLLLEPHEVVRNPEGEGYKVYSPFARKWLAAFREPHVQRRVAVQARGLDYLRRRAQGHREQFCRLTWDNLLGDKQFPDNLQKYRQENQKQVTVDIPPTGAEVLCQMLDRFAKKVDGYQGQRDFPSEDATSQFSMYLKNGSLTVPQIVAALQLRAYEKKQESQDVFFSELIWREFYYHVLYRHPQVETEAFVEKFKNIPWENNKDWFAAWKDGRTGFPIVDAGMRQLRATGWMHNRVRMIVASFLTKDLLIDWKWGEKYFMDQLLDGDLAPNNGGWQWAASTGCDPQPYFRIFNPWLQSKRFDGQGLYIKKYVPELQNLEAKKLHEPILGHPSYPEPIVDHKVQRGKALDLYGIASGKIKK